MRIVNRPRLWLKVLKRCSEGRIAVALWRSMTWIRRRISLGGTATGIHTIASSRERTRVEFYPCDDEHYPEDGAWNCCIIRYPIEGRYQYCSMRECPYGWNVLERMDGEFCVLPEWEGNE